MLGCNVIDEPFTYAGIGGRYVCWISEPHVTVDDQRDIGSEVLIGNAKCRPMCAQEFTRRQVSGAILRQAHGATRHSKQNQPAKGVQYLAPEKLEDEADRELQLAG
jgi:hypothetical protein